MVGKINIKPIAQNPSLQLPTVNTFINSPSTVQIFDVPQQMGNWRITDITLRIDYPDNSINTTQCKQVGNNFIGTLPAPSTSGKVEKGFQIIANGVDENGNPVVGYCLGIGDVQVMDRDGSIQPSGTSHYMTFLSGYTDTPSAGMCFIDEGLIIFDGSNWHEFTSYDEFQTAINGLQANVSALSSTVEQKRDYTDIRLMGYKPDQSLPQYGIQMFAVYIDGYTPNYVYLSDYSVISRRSYWKSNPVGEFYVQLYSAVLGREPDIYLYNANTNSIIKHFTPSDMAQGEYSLTFDFTSGGTTYSGTLYWVYWQDQLALMSQTEELVNSSVDAGIQAAVISANSYTDTQIGQVLTEEF